jgi:hypothetical protein
MAEEIKRYKTVRYPTHKELDDAVTKSLQSGWQPFGSPYIMNGSEGFFICQALTSTIGPLGPLQAK